MGTPRGAHPSRKGSGDALDIRVQGRIEGSVMAGVIPNEIKQGGARAARVMKVRRGVPQPRPQVQEGGRGAAGHAPKAIGGAAGYPLKERKHGMDPRFSLQGLHKVHLRRAGVGEHVIHPCPSQRAHERRSAITQTLPRFLGHNVPSPRGVQPTVFLEARLRRKGEQRSHGEHHPRGQQMAKLPVPGWQPLPEPGLLLKEPGEQHPRSQNERPQQGPGKQGRPGDERGGDAKAEARSAPGRLGPFAEHQAPLYASEEGQDDRAVEQPREGQASIARKPGAEGSGKEGHKPSKAKQATGPGHSPFLP